MKKRRNNGDREELGRGVSGVGGGDGEGGVSGGGGLWGGGGGNG